MSGMSTPRGRAYFAKHVFGSQDRAYYPLEQMKLRDLQDFSRRTFNELQYNRSSRDVSAAKSELEKARQERRKTLPIYQIEQKILSAVKTDPIVIVTAETGAGKSTQVPQMLLEAGYTVTMTQPRRLAAFSVANRIAEERGVALGHEVGFQHAMRSEVSSDSKLVVCTDGFAFHRILHSSSPRSDILILDEFHERNESMDSIIALHREALKKYNKGEGPRPPKLIIMSATIDAEDLSRSLKAPVLHAEGRTFRIEERVAADTMVADVLALAEEGKNTLVFLPGKAEIRAMEMQLHEAGIDAEVIPLHSQLTREEQELAFRSYERPKVVIATNIAETSITIPDIHAVVDSGMERSLEVIDGVETLNIHPISRFNVLQRRGRCGRCGPGVYIYHGKEELKKLQERPTPAIQRVNLSKVMLALTVEGKHIDQLPYLDRPPEELVDFSARSLRQLDLLSSSGNPTKMGRRVSELPVSVSVGKMLAYAEKLASKKQSLAPLVELSVDIAAIIESEGIVLPEKAKKWRRLTKETESDPIAQLEVLHAIEERESPNLDKMGIDSVALRRALEHRELLTKRMKLGERPEELHQLVHEISHDGAKPLTPQAAMLRAELFHAIWSGQMDTIFHRVDRDERGVTWKNMQARGLRRLGKGSVIEGATYIVGRPFDLLVLREQKDALSIPLILLASQVDMRWVKKYANAELKLALRESHSRVERRIQRREKKKRYANIYTRRSGPGRKH